MGRICVLGWVRMVRVLVWLGCFLILVMLGSMVMVSGFIGVLMLRLMVWW